MKNKRFISAIVSLCLCLQLLPGITVFAEGEPEYGNELLSDTGFEESKVGERPTGVWRPYTSFNNAFPEVISKTDFPDFVYEGNNALRFVSTGGDGGYGIRSTTTCY